MSVPVQASHELRRPAKIALELVLAAVVVIRAVAVIDGLRRADEAQLLAFPLAVIFPSLLCLALAAMPPARSREGALMRVGTMIQCTAIVFLPKLALPLALGLPVVFIVVELFETRCPPRLRDVIARRLVT